ncbi:hypothetical protein IQ16_07335 [Bradyrhizobium huanghuaihaiense]|uniref:Uncharacterized protein n=1 Tax=Bradyrhizobium huanghuaihaiense TaxID=990078 RepID=A0A562QWJ4_9BRAD|nr:hypothetical protein [Bradyrhizobium huanghuaihaiense]TWI60983.1 hypothetical protein IQ16_07335 [Bradyrhizobium huanghuaihaiense]
MKTPSSPHFTPVDLKRYFNAKRANAGEGFAARPGDTGWIDSLRGLQTHRGMPFLFGSEIGPDVLELRPGAPPAVIALPPTMASYVLFVQVAADRPSASPEGFGEIGPATLPVEGNPLGDRVATYGLRYADGSETDVPVLRRFAIQQNHISWSASAFAALPLRAPIVHASTGEDFVLGRAPGANFFQGEARTQSGRMDRQGENVWLYALPNPYPDKELSALSLRAEQEISLVFAVTTTALTQHPLRLQGRRKLKVRLPPGFHLNKLGELDVDDRGEQIGMDLGTVISARAVLEYSRADWLGAKVDVQPVRCGSEVIVEYSAHPDARLYLRSDDGRLHMFELRSLEGGGNAGASLMWRQSNRPQGRSRSASWKRTVACALPRGCMSMVRMGSICHPRDITARSIPAGSRTSRANLPMG